MPRGRTEDWVLIEFRDRLMEAAQSNGQVDHDQMWEDLRQKVEASLESGRRPSMRGWIGAFSDSRSG